MTEKILVEHLVKKYGDNTVLNDINVSINEGDVVCVIGPSGSGKSTFLRCLNQLEEASSGDIIIDGANLTDKNTDINQVRQHIGMVFQHFNLFPHLSILENIVLAPTDLGRLSKDEAEKKALELLERVGLADKKDAYPDSLSGGQKQKLFLVSALQNSPEYFFLDEITTGLDSESRGELFKFLSSNLKVKNSTLLLVTHYLEEALQLCDRFIILKDGKIIADLQKSDLIQEEFSFVEFLVEVPEFEAYKLKEKQYKLPKELAEQAIIKFNKELVLYQKTYRINLEELLS